jgi:hypothetical protein
MGKACARRPAHLQRVVRRRAALLGRAQEHNRGQRAHRLLAADGGGGRGGGARARELRGGGGHGRGSPPRARRLLLSLLGLQLLELVLARPLGRVLWRRQRGVWQGRALLGSGDRHEGEHEVHAVGHACSAAGLRGAAGRRRRRADEGHRREPRQGGRARDHGRWPRELLTREADELRRGRGR